MGINELVKQAHDNAVSKGWWEEDRSFGEIIALIHSELSEALEDYREGNKPAEVWYEHKHPLHRVNASTGNHVENWIVNEEMVPTIGKPCGIPSELADVVIRVFDACGRYGIDLEKVITEKMAYNATRPQRHGGKVI